MTTGILIDAGFAEADLALGGLALDNFAEGDLALVDLAELELERVLDFALVFAAVAKWAESSLW